MDFQDANLNAMAQKTPSVCQNERWTRDERSSRWESAVTNRCEPLRECTDARDGVAEDSCHGCRRSLKPKRCRAIGHSNATHENVILEVKVSLFLNVPGGCDLGKGRHFIFSIQYKLLLAHHHVLSSTMAMHRVQMMKRQQQNSAMHKFRSQPRLVWPNCRQGPSPLIPP